MDPGLFLFWSCSSGRRIYIGRRWLDRPAPGGTCSLTTCRKAASVLADGMPCTFPADAARWAAPGHAMAEAKMSSPSAHPLHFGCVLALRGHTTWCWWSGMCAVLHQTPCSETPHPTGCSRLGTAEVEPHARSPADSVVRPHPTSLAAWVCHWSSYGHGRSFAVRPSDPVQASFSRRSQVVEGSGLQSRRRKPASVRIGSPSPAMRVLSPPIRTTGVQDRHQARDNRSFLR